MEYISVEKFLKLPKEVQDIFWNWWKPSKGDINYSPVRNGIEVIEIENNSNQRRNLGYILLLTEGQLRKFIEDKTNGIVKLIQWNPIIDNEKHGYDIHILAKDQYKVLCTFNYKTLGTDLLQAYWKVAIQIAEQL